MIVVIKRTVAPVALGIVFVLFMAVPALASEEESSSGPYTMVESGGGKIICVTGHVIEPGDQYLTSGNLFYEVVRVEGTTAYADYLGQKDLVAELPRESLTVRIRRWATGLLGLAGSDNSGPVAIYHTHSDESYEPTDGRSSLPGEGGVYKVGQAIAATLQSEGKKVVHSYANHDPHDGLAYDRSRRTAMDLLKRNPSALLDVHRDAGPRQEYADTINGRGVTQVQIVLGRSNPNIKANEAFAWQIKAVVDRIDPGLIKGIFYGNGKYNQDLSPRALLLEFGTEKNSREAAERGADLFAKASASILEKSSLPGGAFGGAQGGVWRAILYVLGGLLVVTALFLLINAGSLRGALHDLRHFWGREFTGAPGDKDHPRDDGDEEG